VDERSPQRRPNRLGARGALCSASAKVAQARELFEEASRIDGRCFAAFLGLGAAFDHERFDLFASASALPLFHELEGLAEVVPDLPVLTAIEERVVRASAHSLRGCLPVIAKAGAHIRLLPIDVRATDLSEFLEQTDRRAKDHRSYDALGGLAIPRLAVARVDELLDVVSDHGLVFAHELAHLAFFHLAPEKRTEVESIFGQAAEIGWVAEGYALENPDEFFAVSYTDWLRATLNLPLRREPDEAGVFDAVGRVFSELAQG
jgi:hypothetical protein